MIKQVPGLPGVHGRPILHDLQPGVRHLAYHRAGTWYTWCGLEVPADHRCPSDREVSKAPPWVMLNCPDCNRAYVRTRPDIGEHGPDYRESTVVRRRPRERPAPQDEPLFERTVIDSPIALVR